MTPLKRERLNRGWTLVDVSERLEALGVDRVDSGNLSRIERGVQRASVALAENLCRAFDHRINEIQILYPERFHISAHAVEK